MDKLIIERSGNDIAATCISDNQWTRTHRLTHETALKLGTFLTGGAFDSDRMLKLDGVCVEMEKQSADRAWFIFGDRADGSIFALLDHDEATEIGWCLIDAVHSARDGDPDRKIFVRPVSMLLINEPDPIE